MALSGFNSDGSIENNHTETAFNQRHEIYEDYRGAVDAESFFQMLCQTYHETNTGNGYYSYTDGSDDSILAQRGLFLYRLKKAIKHGNGTERHEAYGQYDDWNVSDMKDEGELPEDAGLPQYVEEYPEPDYDHFEVTINNCEEYGVDTEVFPEDRTLYVPEVFSPDFDENGDIQVWEDGDAISEATTVLKDLRQISDKRAGRIINKIQENPEVFAEVIDEA